MRILFADDDIAMRTLVEHIISEMGHEPILACDGLDALIRLEKEPFDLAVIALGAGAFFHGALHYILNIKELKNIVNLAAVIGFLCYTGAMMILVSLPAKESGNSPEAIEGTEGSAAFADDEASEPRTDPA